jgi:hypothetical protein
MKTRILWSLLASTTVVLGLAACNKPESPSKVSSDVADAQADRQEDVAAARADQNETQAKTSGEAVSPDPDDRGDAIKKRASAQYDTAIAAA